MHIIAPTDAKKGGVGFRNESVSQVEILPQLFHPHTYSTPKLPIQYPTYPFSYPPSPPTTHPLNPLKTS